MYRFACLSDSSGRSKQRFCDEKYPHLVYINDQLPDVQIEV